MRRAFYQLDGPWYRRGVAEALGSRRYSQPALFEIDRKLAELMPWKGGTFVEAGAHDGYTQSNTYYLERQRGWTGVLVEPVPELGEKCRRRRSHSQVFGYALVGADHRDPTVTIHFGDLMSTVGAAEHAQQGLITAGRRPYSTSVPARTLSAVLDEAGLESPDVIILDLEGHEPDVLTGLDLDRHTPRYLLLEALDPDRGRAVFDAALTPRYGHAGALSDYDLLYERR